MKLSINLVAAALGVALIAGPVLAEYPERNIENIYPWNPGVTMAASQVIADAMGEELGVNISVVSTPGAGGVKAFETALSREANGYTIFDGYVAPLVLQPMQGNAEWSYEDFTPLWSATANAFAIAVRKGEDRFTDLPGLIEYMRERPGELRYSPGSPGALPHMSAAKVMQVSDVHAQVVPYPEIDAAARDVRGGILDFMVINTGVYKINKEDVDILVVLSDFGAASETYGGAPLLSEYGIDTGMTGLSTMGWNWWLVHKDTPADIVAQMQDAMGAALAREDIQARLIDMGYVPTLLGPDVYTETVGPIADQIQGGIDAIAWEQEKLGQ
ncbi:tripartite tricarboxylate transporter substrate binding protein [uncultured Ruegeria sp.]|uniref:Bug family tripartite tricarboxylate transporter substrate binding protein n=1 Tax=uncultured Ruegeria sp. TaxID=259304 RepID=UPI00260D4ECA|nr:tripartite tricarboxylate transporter substrate-binding protein [uncultured Ruegeria sp.]